MTGSRRRWPLVTGAAVLLFAAVAALLAGRGWAPFPFERAAVEWSAAHRPHSARAVAGAVTSLGYGLAPYLLALAAGAVLLRTAPQPRPPHRTVPLLIAPLLWLLAGQLLRQGIMHACGRPRPPRADWAGAASGFSFPSGHSFTSALAAGLFALAVARAHPAAARTAFAGACAFALAVGLSRVYLAVHWPLDVLAGWLLACACLAPAAALLHRHTAPPPGDRAP